MSSSKRRKLDTEEPPQPMSAFALRKKLLAQQSLAASPTVVPVDVVETPGEVSSPQKKSRKSRSSRHTSIEPRATSSAQQSSESRSGPSVDQIDEEASSLSPFSLEESQNQYDTRGPPQPVNFSSFRPTRSNFRKRKDKVVQLKLDEGERLVVFGSYGIRVESGEVTVYGATLNASKSTSWIHAPQSHALPVIRCADDATLELHTHPGAHDIKEFGRISPLFRRLWWEDPSVSSQHSVSSGETYRILYTSEDVPKKATFQDLKSPPEWNREMATLLARADSAPTSVMITGPKSSGKSTFGKILLNRLLTTTSADRQRSGYGGVVVLDLDPGQPEYCGVGQIGLIQVTEPVLSPPFCRPVDVPGIRTVRSHALASLSPASDPELYIEMAIDLITHYRNTLGSCPLMINTPGWIQGTGLDLLVSLIGELRPSKVIYMSQLGPADTVEALEEACNTTSFSTLPSQPNPNGLRTAANLRSMQMMAYFHAETTPRKPGGNSFHWFQRPLTTMAPLQVRLKGAGSGIFGVLCYGFQIQPDLVADAINGTILAAVEVESMKAFRDMTKVSLRLKDSNNVADDANPGSPMELDASESGLPKLTPFWNQREKITTLTAEGIPFIDTSHGLTLDPRYSRCLGLVLVRGIDAENGYLHLLSPITTDQIKDVRARGGHIVLVSGKFDPPSWAYTEELHFQSEGDEGDGNEGPEPNDLGESTGDNPEDVKSNVTPSNNIGSVPWIEVLARNQKRGAGSKAWRVRRDLGRD